MKQLIKLIPDWANIIYSGLRYDETETYRTVRHIFRSLWIYFTIMNDKFESNIKDQTIKSFKKDLEKISHFQMDFFPLILLYHDIGRPFNREWHTFESAKIIQQRKVIQKLNINSLQELILTGVIRHHLLPGTIFTGESSYYGASSLYNDKELGDIWLSYENIEIFFHTLMAFTIIDIWGYDYSKIYEHYFLHYNKIRENLTRVFAKSDSIEQKDLQLFFYRELSKLDDLNLKWRIACALRIFQFVNTRSYLTEEFYFAKIDQGLNNRNQNWNDFARSLGLEHSLIQFKYALPIMMVLASGNFARKPFDPNEKILPGIFNFWQTCTSIVKTKDKETNSFTKNDHWLWNFIFNLPRGWFVQSKKIKYVLSDRFLKNIKESSVVFDSNLESYLVNIK